MASAKPASSNGLAVTCLRLAASFEGRIGGSTVMGLVKGVGDGYTEGDNAPAAWSPRRPWQDGHDAVWGRFVRARYTVVPLLVRHVAWYCPLVVAGKLLQTL